MAEFFKSSNNNNYPIRLKQIDYLQVNNTNQTINFNLRDTHNIIKWRYDTMNVLYKDNKSIREKLLSIWDKNEDNKRLGHTELSSYLILLKQYIPINSSWTYKNAWYGVKEIGFDVNQKVFKITYSSYNPSGCTFCREYHDFISKFRVGQSGRIPK